MKEFLPPQNATQRLHYLWAVFVSSISFTRKKESGILEVKSVLLERTGHSSSLVCHLATEFPEISSFLSLF